MVVKEGEIAVSGRIVGYSELKKLHLDSVCEACSAQRAHDGREAGELWQA
jgi:hypothetical protein